MAGLGGVVGKYLRRRSGGGVECPKVKEISGSGTAIVKTGVGKSVSDGVFVGTSVVGTGAWVGVPVDGGKVGWGVTVGAGDRVGCAVGRGDRVGEGVALSLPARQTGEPQHKRRTTSREENRDNEVRDGVVVVVDVATQVVVVAILFGVLRFLGRCNSCVLSRFVMVVVVINQSINQSTFGYSFVRGS